jgi:hypothetical protein
MEAGTPIAKPLVHPPAAAQGGDTARAASGISALSKVPFGVNEVRLNAWQWLATFLIVALVILLTPWLWERLERFDTGPDYRIPYDLSKDYWLYGRRLRQVASPDKVIVLGDSVVWGEYVAPDGTLSHFLDQATAATNRFVNGGLNGLFPLAQEGLVTWYGKSLHHQKVILQCNLLWMTSPKADLSLDKEEQFNHSRLVPQFSPRIPCYRADANERLSAVLQREVTFLQWVGHLQNAYFGQKSILSWTLEDDGGNPPRYPNVYRNPFAQITLVVPPCPQDDPQRGLKSPRHKPWSTDGQATTRFEWVPLDSSLQWHAFQRVVSRLRDRGNDVLVVLGPFNEHMMTVENRAAYQGIRDGIAAWLRQNNVRVVVPEALPSALYADASHPLTQGYELLANRLCADETFRNWLRSSGN